MKGTNTMNTKSFQQLFLVGARKLVAAGKEFGDVQRAAGFAEEEWELLTQKECWNVDQQRQIPSLITNAVSMTMAIAGLPAVPLPVENVAATISLLVAPCNQQVAAHNAPEAFDSMSASGLVGPSVVKNVKKEQLLSQINYFATQNFLILEALQMDSIIEKAVQEAQLNGNLVPAS